MSSLTFQPVRWVRVLCPLVFWWLLLLAAKSETLTNFAQVRALSQEEAKQHIPVRLDAIVLGADPAIPWNFFLHDGTAGCYVQLLPGTNTPYFSPGTKLRLNGISQSLGYYPSVTRAQVEVIGKGEIPAPVRLLADQIFSPELDSAWVEVPGRVNPSASTIIATEDAVPIVLQEPRPQLRQASNSFQSDSDIFEAR